MRATNLACWEASALSALLLVAALANSFQAILTPFLVAALASSFQAVLTPFLLAALAKSQTVPATLLAAASTSHNVELGVGNLLAVVTDQIPSALMISEAIVRVA